MRGGCRAPLGVPLLVPTRADFVRAWYRLSMFGLRATRSMLFVLASMAGCNGARSDGGPLPVSEYETKLLETACAVATRCGSFPDVATCKACGALGWTTERQLAGVKSGRIQYDGNEAAACLAALAGRGCNLKDVLEHDPLSCLDTFKGIVPAGGVCYFAGDCASTSCNTGTCSPSATCCSGTCDPGEAPANPIPVGGDCTGFFADCANGTYCGRYSPPYVCTVEASLGQDCDTNGVRAVCQQSSICTPSASAMGGTCAPPPTEGEPCDLNSNPTPCNSFLDYCDLVSQTCVRKLGPGQPCPRGAGCVDYTSCRSGKCVLLGKLGEACDTTATDSTCMAGLQCEGGTCALAQAGPVCE